MVGDYEEHAHCFWLRDNTKIIIERGKDVKGPVWMRRVPTPKLKVLET
jgi:hypothetical protein